MAFNMYKQIDNIKTNLNEQGYEKDIPKGVFGRTLMIMFGMKKRTAINWIDNFTELNLINIKEDIVNFT